MAVSEPHAYSLDSRFLYGSKIKLSFFLPFFLAFNAHGVYLHLLHLYQRSPLPSYSISIDTIYPDVCDSQSVVRKTLAGWAVIPQCQHHREEKHTDHSKVNTHFQEVCIYIASWYWLTCSVYPQECGAGAGGDGGSCSDSTQYPSTSASTRSTQNQPRRYVRPALLCHVI